MIFTLLSKKKLSLQFVHLFCNWWTDKPIFGVGQIQIISYFSSRCSLLEVTTEEQMTMTGPQSSWTYNPGEYAWSCPTQLGEKWPPDDKVLGHLIVGKVRKVSATEVDWTWENLTQAGMTQHKGQNMYRINLQTKQSWQKFDKRLFKLWWKISIEMWVIFNKQKTENQNWYQKNLKEISTRWRLNMGKTSPSGEGWKIAHRWLIG